MTTPHEKAAEALRCAAQMDAMDYPDTRHAAHLLREYAALLQAQPADAGRVLPPMPAPDRQSLGGFPAFTTQQMRDYALAAIQRLEAENAKAREIIDQLCACHDEPECPAVAVAREWLADAAMTKEQKT